MSTNEPPKVLTFKLFKTTVDRVQLSTNMMFQETQKYAIFNKIKNTQSRKEKRLEKCSRKFI